MTNEIFILMLIININLYVKSKIKKIIVTEYKSGKNIMVLSLILKPYIDV